VSALRRRELVAMAEPATCRCGSAAGLALALDELERRGWTVAAAVDDAGDLLAGQLSAAGAREVAAVAGRDGVRGLLARAPVGGGWALVAADGALVLLLTGRRGRVRRDLIERIRRERAAGSSHRAIASGLEHDGVPAPRGGPKWSHRTVAYLLERSA
jgi:hypothetical protein